MSSAMNHKKRSHRSERIKRGVFNTSSRKFTVRLERKDANRSVLKRLINLFYRRALKPAPKNSEKDDEV